MSEKKWKQRERELARLLMTLDYYLCDFDGYPAQKALEHYSGTFLALDTEPWANGKHSGDCTKECHTCARCLCEWYLEKARIQCETFDKDLPEERDQLLAVARAAKKLTDNTAQNGMTTTGALLLSKLDDLLLQLPSLIKAEIEK